MIGTILSAIISIILICGLIEALCDILTKDDWKNKK